MRSFILILALLLGSSAAAETFQFHGRVTIVPARNETPVITEVCPTEEEMEDPNGPGPQCVIKTVYE